MLTNFDVEGILRDDLRRARERVQQTLASFLRIADQAGAGAPERLDQAAADHSVARDQVVAAIQRWNQFCQFGTVPEDLAVKTKRIAPRVEMRSRRPSFRVERLFPRVSASNQRYARCASSC